MDVSRKIQAGFILPHCPRSVIFSAVNSMKTILKKKYILELVEEELRKYYAPGRCFSIQQKYLISGAVLFSRASAYLTPFS